MDVVANYVDSQTLDLDSESFHGSGPCIENFGLNSSPSLPKVNLRLGESSWCCDRNILDHQIDASCSNFPGELRVLAVPVLEYVGRIFEVLFDHARMVEEHD